MGKRVLQESSDEDNDDVPLIHSAASTPMKNNVAPTGPAELVVKGEEHSDNDRKPVISNGNGTNGHLNGEKHSPPPLNDDVTEPAPKRRKSTKAEKKYKSSSDATPKKPRSVKKEEVTDTPPKKPASQSKKKSSSTSAKTKNSSTAKQKVKVEDGGSEENGIEKTEQEEEEEEEEYKWWVAQAQGDGTTKWTTLEHNGVLFPPDYQPHGVRMKYNGAPVTLPPESEEVASFFGSMLNSDHVQNEVFCENFFKDFQAILKEYPPKENIKITDFDKCDFTPIFEHFEAERAKKKAMTRDEKKAEKVKKEALEESYQFCFLDGRKEKVGNFRVEPPSLFRGRGKHPKTGKLKQRVKPEQITINIGKDAKIPTPPAGHSWGKVIHDDTVTWLAMWKENINGAFKYVFLAAGSSLKGQSDFKKFEKARQLKDHIDRIRMDYSNELRDKQMVIRQRATAMYLIDRLALRAGNEKGEDEADTVGCCSLRCEHVTLTPPTTLYFDFLGKDSIRFQKEASVDEQVFKNMRIFKKEPKEEGDMVFDRLTTTLLNKHLGSYMQGLSAKVFRTYNASYTFEKELLKTDPNASLADKLLAYNRANREVAVLCNHQRSVSKNHSASMEKLADKLRAMKYQRRKLRHALFTVDSSLRKKHKELVEDESDIDDEWMEAHEADLLEKERVKVTKKFEKENEKLAEEGQKVMGAEDLEERLQAASDEHEQSVEERKTGKVTSIKRAPEKILEAIDKLDKRIEAQRVATVDREENKETSLGTSKINYIDPRLTYSWCARFDVPVEKIFNKSLREKFPWAADVDADWKF